MAATEKPMQDLRSRLLEGHVIPACPLPLTSGGKWSEQHQRALVRYYSEAGAGGLAVGVHSTQFEIRDPEHGLFEPVLELVAGELPDSMVKIAGICGETKQALAEVEFALGCGYQAGLLSMKALGNRPEADVLDHCRLVAHAIPIIGFYLQPAVGGRVFSYRFWREFAEIENVAAIKLAPFDRYLTLDVVRAVGDSGREDIALYTGNDDNIISDLVTTFPGGQRIVGGLLGQWGVWTKRAVETLDRIKALPDDQIPAELLTENAILTEGNAAVFDAANGFGGCIPGIMEVLRRTGLTPSNRCLNPEETLSPGQAEELDRIAETYPHLNDDAFIAENLDRWLG
ncbi:MAG: dihydrodipicolinate synthase/N-acetylneuraminate lyase [Verrucomicrobiales bacterium]|jgi:dihydrodipicolinate synthase/N-acetylneuraminate lyase